MAESRACALDFGGRVWCWGDPPIPGGADTGGPLVIAGLPTITQISAGTKRHCALDDGGSVRCWGGNGYGQAVPNGPKTVISPTVVKGLEPMTQVTAGSYSTCAISPDGALWCWGSGGRFGLDNQLSPTQVGPANVVSVSLGGAHQCVTTDSGNVICWGVDLNGATGAPPSGTFTWVEPTTVGGLSAASAVSVGELHSCALQSGRVFCWGDNSAGQLGPSVPAKGTHLGTMRDELSTIIELQAEPAGACALHVDGTVWCWGAANVGLLGNGMTQGSSPTPVAVQLVE